MTPNEISEAARQKIARKPALEKKMRDAWSVVEKAIDEKAASSKKKWKVYEVHNLHRFARLEMLTAFVEGASPDECALRAMAKAGLVS